MLNIEQSNTEQRRQQSIARRQRSNLALRLKRQGFDGTKSVNGSVRVRCSQCEAAVINGIAAHETGCPNSK